MSIDPSIPPPSGPPVPPPDLTPPSSPAPPPAASVEASAPPAAAASAPPAVAAAGENTVAVIAYMTLIGFIVAIVLNKDAKKNSLGNYHLRQMLGLLILGIGGSVIINIVALALHRVPVIGTLVGLTGWAFQIVLIVAWVLGLIDALNRREKPIPVIGPVIQDKLKNVFAS